VSPHFERFPYASCALLYVAAHKFHIDTVCFCRLAVLNTQTSGSSPRGGEYHTAHGETQARSTPTQMVAEYVTFGGDMNAHSFWSP
jgi:hypothetical protein